MTIQLRIEIPPDVQVEVISKNSDGSPSVLALTPTFYRGDAKPVVGYVTVEDDVEVDEDEEESAESEEARVISRCILHLWGSNGELRTERRGSPVQPNVISKREKPVGKIEAAAKKPGTLEPLKK